MERAVRTDVIDPDRAGALAGLLDLDPSRLRDGDPLPPMWQLVYFLSRPAQRNLAVDGHPVDEIGSAPRPGLRRMFAGGRLWLTPGLRLGQTATAEITVTGRRETQGRDGALSFVTTGMSVSGVSGRCLVDERDIVYVDRPAPASVDPAACPPVAAQSPSRRAWPEHTRVVDIDPTLLFRFSALTYNAHRIHYDRDYAHSLGYPGLVVHGPLQALLMAQSAVESMSAEPGSPIPGMVLFTYKLVAPLFEAQGLGVTAHARSGSRVDVKVSDAAGRVTARGELRRQDGATDNP